MSFSALAVAALFASQAAAGSSSPDSVPVCQAFEAKLNLEARTVPKGRRPGFTLTLRNTRAKPLRFLDTRNGRRPDLGDNYFTLVVRTKQGEDPHIPRAISDPGPISDEDYFILPDGEIAQIAITSSLALEALRTGPHVAHVVVWVDPLKLGSRCRSRDVEFVVH